MLKRNKQIIFVILFLAIVVIVNISVINQYFLQNFVLNEQQQQTTRNVTKQDVDLYQIMREQYDVQHGKFEGAPYKRILYWNSYATLHDYEQFGMGVGRDGYRKAGCPVWQCETSQDRSDLLKYDAILFHYRHWNGRDKPPIRLPSQRYIFVMKESPAWPWPPDSSYSQVKGFFNWTMTYRWDSDVVQPYAWIEPTGSLSMNSEPIDEPLPINYAAGKTKMAVWLVSNCQSRSGREGLVNKLTEFGVRVDRYGRCGNLNCGVPQYEEVSQGNRTEEAEREDQRCRTMVASEHKFYLSLENSLCLEYITEKFFAILDHPIVPIVMDAHGHHARAAPAHSFINALDFPTVRDLADYLIQLDKNDTLYNEYFWWKKHYRVRNSNPFRHHQYKTFCSLCAALHDPSLTSSFRSSPQPKVYDDMKVWWKDTADCKTVVLMNDENATISVVQPPFNLIDSFNDFINF